MRGATVCWLSDGFGWDACACVLGPLWSHGVVVCCTIEQLVRSAGLALYIVLIDMSMYGAWQRTIAEIAIGMCPSTA